MIAGRNARYINSTLFSKRLLRRSINGVEILSLVGPSASLFLFFACVGPQLS